VETGKIVLDYVAQGLPLEGLTHHLTRELISRNSALILDTHYARYSDREEQNKQFMRGMETEDLKRLLDVFHIHSCLVEVQIHELERRRKNDPKRRPLGLFYIQQELEFNQRGYRLYLKDLTQEPFILVNDDYTTAKALLVQWIMQHQRLC
jgi:hypothetical protein